MAITISEAIQASNLPKKEELLGLVRQALWVHTVPTFQESLIQGESHFGGLPDLPSELGWPKWQGISLSFIGQINLSELPDFSDRSLFPKHGFLYFFYDSTREACGMNMSEHGSFAVYYSNDLKESLNSRDAPADLKKDDQFIPARLSYEIFETEPGLQHPVLERIGLSEDEIWNDYADVVLEFDDYSYEHHQILGYPLSIQHPVAMDCERAQMGFWDADDETKMKMQKDIKRNAEDWELLLQVMSDEELGMYWPADVGTLYYMIRRSDLQAQRFDRAWLIKQFH